MASIRQLKKDIEAVRTEFDMQCGMAYFYGEDPISNAVEVIHSEANSQWDEIMARLKDYDRTASKKEIAAHFKDIQQGVLRVLEEHLKKIQALTAGNNSKE